MKPELCTVSGCANPIKYSGPGWCGKHYRRHRTHGTTDRPVRTKDRAALMWAKLDGADCWLFTGARDAGGYGHFWDGSRVVRAHRWVWEYLIGPIPDGMELDHLCRQPACCNPDHLEPVSPRVNTLRSSAPTAQHARKTHCPQGHPYAGENLQVALRSTGRARICRTCARAKKRAYKERRRAAS